MDNAIRNARSGGLQSAKTNTIVDLREALRKRLAIIHDEGSRRNPDAHIARLRAVSETIDELQESLPPPVEPRLKHYLERKSYDKALEYLETSCSAGQRPSD